MSLFFMLLEQSGFSKSQSGLVNGNATLLMTLAEGIAVLSTHATRTSVTFTLLGHILQILYSQSNSGNKSLSFSLEIFLQSLSLNGFIDAIVNFNCRHCRHAVSDMVFSLYRARILNAKSKPLRPFETCLSIIYWVAIVCFVVHILLPDNVFLQLSLVFLFLRVNAPHWAPWVSGPWAKAAASVHEETVGAVSEAVGARYIEATKVYRRQAEVQQPMLFLWRNLVKARRKQRLLVKVNYKLERVILLSYFPQNYFYASAENLVQHGDNFSP